MKNLTLKSKMTALFVIALIITSAFTLLTTPLFAQEDEDHALNPQDNGSLRLPAGVTPDLTLDSIAYLSVTPNPIGLNQPFLVNIWTHPPIHNSRYHSDYTVTITKPDGSQDVIVLDSYQGDSTAWFPYIADQVGTWTFKFDFIGSYFPAGNYTRTRLGYSPTVTEFEESVYYQPSSTPEYEVTVQEDIVFSWPESPLPTDYWTRPVIPDHREWWPILGNYPGTGYVGGGQLWDELYPGTNPYWNDRLRFHPWVQAPNSAHIVWKRQGDVGGLIGGVMGQISYYENNPGYPDIIYAGRAYQTLTKVVNGEPTRVWQCYDIRTGEIYWEQTGITRIPDSITYTVRDLNAVPGEEAHLRGLDVSLLYTGQGHYIKYDPWTGDVNVDIDISPLSSGTLYRDPYLISVQNLGGGNYRLINWTAGRDPNTGETHLQVLNNITWPFNSISAYTDFNAGVSVRTENIGSEATGVSIGVRIMGIDINTGEILWNVTTDLSSGLETFFSSNTAVADHGKFAVRMNTGEIKCWDLRTGHQVWTVPLINYPWGIFGAYHVQSAYGLYYTNSYDGVHAIDWDSGEVVWEFKAETPYSFETPYHVNGTGVYAFHGGGIVADGKFYTSALEHSPSNPIQRGWKLYCLNATTGEKIWEITASSVDQSRAFTGAISDGYLAFANYYDSIMYVFGKGQSETSVTASPKTVARGANVLIEGSILDMSPAQTGTACVADESMGEWMEYLHMQKPMPDNVIGVTVLLTAIDSEGNVETIGEATTDASGNFGTTWTPQTEGDYKIMATFMGTESYGSSYSTTYLSVGPANSPSTTIEPEEPTTPDIPDTPETPSTPETPDTPDTPETPDQDEPETPNQQEAEPLEHPLSNIEIAIIIGIIAAAIIGSIAYIIIRKRR